eukprot:g3966.t1
MSLALGISARNSQRLRELQSKVTFAGSKKKHGATVWTANKVHDLKTLTFFAWYKDNGKLEKLMLRHNLTSNETLISEQEDENPAPHYLSGLKPLILRKPRKDPKSKALGHPYTVEEFKVGNTVKVQKKDVHIYDASAETKLYFKEILKINLPKKALAIPGAKSSMPTWMKYAGTMLRFEGWMKDNDTESADKDAYILRKINITFDVGAQKVSMAESASDLQDTLGTFIKGEKLVKPGVKDAKGNPVYYTLTDFRVGNVIEVKKKKIHIYDASRQAKDFFQQVLGTTLPLKPMAIPVDLRAKAAIDKKAKAKAIRDSDAETIAKRLEKAKLAKKNGRFLDYGDKVLHFNIIETESESEIANRRTLSLRYFVVDDTVDAIETGQRASTDYVFKIARQEAPCDESAMIVGKEIFLNGRVFKILSLDSHSRKYYEDFLGIRQPENIEHRGGAKKHEAVQQVSDEMHLMDDPYMEVKLYENLIREKAAQLADHRGQEEQAKALLKYFDGPNGDGVITLKEFRKALSKMNVFGEVAEALFNLYDTDGSGKLTPNEFVRGIFRSAKLDGLGRSVIEVASTDREDRLSSKKYKCVTNTLKESEKIVEKQVYYTKLRSNSRLDSGGITGSGEMPKQILLGSIRTSETNLTGEQCRCMNLEKSLAELFEVRSRFGTKNEQKRIIHKIFRTNSDCLYPGFLMKSEFTRGLAHLNFGKPDIDFLWNFYVDFYLKDETASRKDRLPIQIFESIIDKPTIKRMSNKTKK